ncbi:MAG: intradiol ring-cleavage dioxygenase [Gaiellaceae bacterium]
MELRILAVAAAVALTAAAPAWPQGGKRCTPTRADSLGPFYVANAPVRAKTGTGHVLTGTVRSSRNCGKIARAKVEFWHAGPAGEYGPRWRATLFSTAAGTYRFQSINPPPYGGRPRHIHIRVSAAGFRTLVTQYYPTEGQTRGRFDLVLVRR